MSRNRPAVKVEVGFGVGALGDTIGATLTNASTSVISTPDSTALRPSTQIDLRVKLALTAWHPGREQTLVSKDSSTSGNFGWRLYGDIGSLAPGIDFQYSTNGTSYNLYQWALPSTPTAPIWLRVAGDVSDTVNGLNLYMSENGLIWTQISPPVPYAAGTFFASTAPLVVGARYSSGNTPAAGSVLAFSLATTIDGPPVASLDLDNIWAPTDTTWTSNAGNPWTAGAGVSFASLWTDVSADWRGELTCAPMGRSSQLDAFNTGSMGLTLANADRKYDPSYAAGPNFGKLKSRVPIRARAKYAGIVYNLFTGLVDGGWQQDYDVGNHDATVSITASDPSILLASASLPNSAYDQAVDEDAFISGGLAGRWTMDNTADVRDQSGNGRDLVMHGAPATADPLLNGSSRAAAVMVDNCYADGAVAPIAAYPFTVEAWVESTAIFDYSQTVSNAVGLFSIQTAAGAVLWQLTMDWLGPNVVGTGGYAASPAEGQDGKSGCKILDGGRHHVAIVMTSGGAAMYVDGVQLNNGFSVLGTPASISTAARVRIGQTGAAMSATVDTVVAWSRQLSAIEILRHANAGQYGRSAETAAARARFVLEAANWPGNRVALVSSTNVQLYASSGAQVLDYLRTLESTERGQVFTDAGGVVRLRPVSANFTDARSTTVQHDFAETDYVTEGFGGVQWDDQRIVNEADVTRAGGAKSSASDPTSVGEFGPKSLSVTDTLNVTDAETKAAAGYYVWLGKDQGDRIDSLPIKPDTNPSVLYPVVLGAQIGDLFTVERTPQKVGAALTVEAHLAGAPVHTISADEWITTFALDSQQAKPGAVLQWGSWAWLDGKTWGP